MTDRRSTALQLASLHLRLGQLGLARAQLEALAGRNALDHGGLVDLVEARWRSGDLTGAGTVAVALVERGQEDLLLLVVAAEAVAADGRPGDARRLAARAEAIGGGSLDALFAGMPRSAIWPEEAAIGLSPDALLLQAREPVSATGVPARTPVSATGVPAMRLAVGPAPAAAAEAFAGGRGALAAGDVTTAALRLGVALRLDPGFAEGVLDALGDWSRDPSLALVAGDAFRLLGREAEALDAFDCARGRP